MAQIRATDTHKKKQKQRGKKVLVTKVVPLFNNIIIIIIEFPFLAVFVARIPDGIADIT